jgi:peptide/nickel transport system ATP-binding protein
MSELRFDDVTVRYGNRRRGMTAVDRVSLTVPDGTVVGLVGESGSGKSTLARAAVGLTPLTSGRILLDGQPMVHRTRGHRPLQMIFQDPYSSLDPRMTIGNTIAEAIPRGSHGLGSGADRRREVGRLLELVGLEPERAGEYPAQLSGGQRQRVAVARALAGQPKVIIADEITSALDVSIQGTVLNLVRDLQRQLGMSMLFISHNLAVVRYVATSVAVMYLGRIVEYGPTAQVLSDPQHPYTRDLLAAVPDSGHGYVTDAELDPAVRAVADAEPADPHHPPTGCSFHPRCPVGPLVHADRDICRTAEPSAEHRHHAACHFAAALDPAPSGPAESQPLPMTKPMTSSTIRSQS